MSSSNARTHDADEPKAVAANVHGPEPDVHGGANGILEEGPGRVRGGERLPGHAAGSGRFSAMAKCIARHRRLQTAVAKLSRRMATSNPWGLSRVTASLGLIITKRLERFARRRLIGRRPIDEEEAEQKILYLIASITTLGTELDAREIAEILASVDEFRTELKALLRDSPGASASSLN